MATGGWCVVAVGPIDSGLVDWIEPLAYHLFGCPNRAVIPTDELAAPVFVLTYGIVAGIFVC